MNFKKLTSVLAAGLLSFTCATAVNAEDFYGSKTQGGTAISGSSTVTTAKGTSVTVYAEDNAVTQSLRASLKSAGSIEAFFKAEGASGLVSELAAVAGNVDDLVCLDVVDVNIGEATLAEGDSVQVSLDVQGILAGDKVIAAHKRSDGAWELVDASAPANDTVTITMTSFSPVMIFKDQTPNNGSTQNNNNAPVTGNYTNIALWGGVLVVAVAAAGIVLFEKKRKAN